MTYSVTVFRDMFIEEHMRPKSKIISESNLDWIFNFDENMQVCSFSTYEKQIARSTDLYNMYLSL